MNQSSVILVNLYKFRNYSSYQGLRETAGCQTFKTLTEWDWKYQPYWKELRTYSDCLTLGVL